MTITSTRPTATIPIIPERECGDCKVCCGGWLSIDVYGSKVYQGKPCRFVGDRGCSIYKERPDVCVKYKCAWLANTDVPGWLKPNQCGAILTESEINGIPYLDVIEAGTKLDSSVLSWAIMQHINAGVNIRYMISGGKNWIGSREFVQAMENNK